MLRARAGPVTVKWQFRELNVTPLRANYEETLPICCQRPDCKAETGFVRGLKSHRLSKKNGWVSKKRLTGRYGAQAVPAPRFLCYLLDFNI